MKKDRQDTGEIAEEKKKGLPIWNCQLVVALILTVAGLVLLFSGFWVDPEGEIDNSVLVAFGETMTFAGGLFGVDYSYRIRN